MSKLIAESSEDDAPRRPHRMRFIPIDDAGKDLPKAPAPSVDSQRQPGKAYTASLAQREQDTPPGLPNTSAQMSPVTAPFARPLLMVSTPSEPALPPVARSDSPSNELMQIWKPGTLGFDSVIDPNISAFGQQATLRTIVVDQLVNKPDQPKIKMQSEVSGTAGAAGIVGLGNIIGTVLKYGVNFLIQYSFGPALYGLYTLSLSLVNLLSSILNLGLDDAMVRFVAIYRGEKQSRPIRGLLIFCTLLAGLTGLIGAICLIIFTPHLIGFWMFLRPNQVPRSKDVLVGMTPLLRVMAPLIPLLCMQVIWFAGLRGFKAFKLRVLATNVVQPTLQLLLLGAALFFTRNIIGAALALIISTVISVILTLNFLIRQFAKVATPEPEEYRLRPWLTFATLNFLTAIIDTVLDSIDTILLASFGVPRIQLGLYGASMRLSAFISVPLTSLANVFAPTIAELHSRGEKERLETMFKVVTKWAITFSLPIFLILVLFSPYILSLSGRDFVAAWPLVIAFALGNLINAGTGTVGYMLLMTGHNRLSFINSLVAVVVNLVLGVFLTPRYGAMGTAISTGLALGVLNIMRLIQVRLVLKIQPYRLDMLKPFGAGLISCLVIGAILLLLNEMRWHVMLGHAIVSAQLAFIPVFLASYVGLLIVFKGSPEDEMVMKALRKKFLRGAKNTTGKNRRGA